MSGRHEIDPAMERRLRKTLTAIAAVADEPDVRSVVLESTAATPRGSGRRQMIALSVSLTAALAVGWALGANTGGQVATAPTTPTGPTDPGPTSAEPSAAGRDVHQLVLDAGAGPTIASACADEAADLADLAAETRPIPVPSPDDVVDHAVLSAPVTAAGAARQVVVAATTTSLMVCEVETGSGAVTDFQVMDLGSAAPGAAAVVIDYPTWYSPTPDGLTGPGWASVLGRLGEGVTAVDLVAADGTVATGVIEGWWFYARVDVAADVALFDERLRWSASDGGHESRVDLLDVDTPAEACARDGDDCIEGRIAEIGAAAAATTDVTADVVADGLVTVDEWRRVRETFALCMRTRGVQVVLAGDGFAFSFSSPAGPGQVWTTPSVPICDAALAPVSELRQLTDARRRLAEG
ncbi:MAG: hypothetical protein ACK5OX_03115 [Desertimonas sp.]